MKAKKYANTPADIGKNANHTKKAGGPVKVKIASVSMAKHKGGVKSSKRGR